MRKLEIGAHRFTEVVVSDGYEAKGENVEYYICRSGGREDVPAGEFGHAVFQCGPVTESGPNGCFIEDLIAICIDRVRAYQTGALPCLENGRAINHLEEALYHLDQRTKDRQKREVEGTSKE